MKLVILYSIVVLCISVYVNAQCNQCGTISNVACFSDTQYFACNAQKQIDVSVLLPCATGVCSNTNPPCSNGPPSCPGVVVIAPPITTTMAPVTVTSATATAYCQTKPPGRYAQPGDLTLTNYVYCYLNGGMMGWVYTCIGTLKFNPTTSSCQ